MTTFTILTTITFGISLVLILTKSELPKVERIIKSISLYSLIGIVVCIILLMFGLRIKGTFTTSIIGLTFVLSTILLFGLTKKNGTKMLSGLFVIPICISGVLSFFWSVALLPSFVLTLAFQPPTAKFEINNNHSVEFPACDIYGTGSLVITKSIFGILDKQKYKGISHCYTGINKIEVIEFNKDTAEFLIFHDGKTEFESPHKYNIKWN